MTLFFRPVQPAMRAELRPVRAPALPLAAMGLDKAAVVSPIVVRGLLRLAEFAGITALGLAIAHIYVDEAGVIGSARRCICF
jgi:hypothetical protein